MLFALMRGRFHTKMRKRHALIFVAAVCCFCALCSAALVTIYNAKEHAASTYWKKVGSADIIALCDRSQENVVTSLIPAQSMVCAHVMTAGVTTGSSASKMATVAYGELAQINEMFNLEAHPDKSDGAVVNATFLTKFNCHLGEKITVGDRSYVISAKAERADALLGAEKTPLVMIPTTNFEEHRDVPYRIALFASLGHREKDIEGTMARLNAQGISCANQFSGYTSTIKEYQNFSEVITVLIAVIAGVFLAVFASLVSSHLRSEWYYLRILRVYGLSRTRLFALILLEQILAAVAGSIVGSGIGSAIAGVICGATGTPILSWFVTANQFIAMVLLSVTLVVGAVCLCFRVICLKEPLGEVSRRASRSHAVRVRTLKILTCIAGVAVAAYSFVVTQHDARNGSLFIVLFFAGMVVVFFASELLIDQVSSFCERKGTGIRKVAGRMLQAARSRTVHLAATLALVLALIGAVVNLGYSCQLWAGVLADQQLNLDARIVATNDIMGNDFINGVVKRDDIESRGTYYTARGKFRQMSAYIMTEADNFSGFLNKFYDSKTRFASLSSHEVVASSYLLAVLGMKVGDEVTISLAGQSKSVRVVGTITTLDYFGSLVIVAPELFEKQSYKNICLNVKGRENLDLNTFTSPALVEKLSRETLRAQWKSQVVSGTEYILALAVTSVCILVLMIAGTVRSDLEDRRREYAMVRMLGLDRRRSMCLLVLETFMWLVPMLVCSFLAIPLVSYAFLGMCAHVTGYVIESQVDFTACALMWLSLFMMVILTLVRPFMKECAKSPITSLIDSW